MTFLQHFQEALVNIKASTLRSLLAVLRHIGGNAAVVALISCGQLATEKALAEFKSPGTNLLAVSVYQQINHQIPRRGDTLSQAQWEQLGQHNSLYTSLAP